MNRPKPPRMTVFPSPDSRQANPTRGAKSFFSEYRRLSGIPACFAVRIGVGPIDAAKSGFRMENASLLEMTTAPLTRFALTIELESRRKFVAFRSPAKNMRAHSKLQ